MLVTTVLGFILTTVSGTFSMGTEILPQVTPEARITNGINAAATEFKFYVQIIYKSIESNLFNGGSIISQQYVLTTAAAFVAERNKIASIELYIGSIYKNEGEKFTVAPRDVTPHEQYQKSPLRNDIALIRSSRKIIYSETVQPVKLPAGRIGIPPYHKVQTAGFGITGFDKGSQEGTSRLLVSDLKTVRSKKCIQKYGDLERINVVCAKSTDGRNPTIGDSGGALTALKESERQHPTIFGIFSFGPSKPVAYNVPLVYTRVDGYVQWIRIVTNEVFD